MLDGYVTAIVIGPCSIPPDEWFVDLLGARGRIATAHGKTLAAIMAVVARFNAISETLSIAPGQHAPIFEKTEDGLALPHPWCMGFLSAMQLRLKAWEPLLDLSSPDHALMLPILLYCVDALGGPMLEPPAEGTEMHEYHTHRLPQHSDRHPRDSRVLDAAARRRSSPSTLKLRDRVASVTFDRPCFGHSERPRSTGHDDYRHVQFAVTAEQARGPRYHQSDIGRARAGICDGRSVIPKGKRAVNLAVTADGAKSL